MKFIKISDGSPYPGRLPDPVELPVSVADGEISEVRSVRSGEPEYRDALIARMFMVGYEEVSVRKANDGKLAKTIALVGLQNAVVELAEKKGPGRGWWGPAHGGTHTPREGIKMTGFSGVTIQTGSIRLKKKIPVSALAGWKGDRADAARQALDRINDGMSGIVLRERGAVTAIASYVVDKKGDLWVENLATKMPGRGRAAMGYIVRSAQREDAKAIKLVSAEAARGFYTKIGMKEFGANFWSWSMSEAEEFLATVEKAAEMPEKEPEDGIFVASRKTAKKSAKIPVHKTNNEEDALRWAKAVEKYIRIQLPLSKFKELTSHQQHLEVNRQIRLYSRGAPLREEWRDAVVAHLKDSDYVPARMAAAYVEEHASVLLKAVHGPRLPEETWEGVEDGSPLASEHYKCWRRHGMRPRWQKGWIQFHWRGMPEKDPADIANHSVHCDLRLHWGKELVQWVLTGKQDKLLRALQGKDDPSTDKVQNAMALVKPAAEEAAERIEAERLVKGEILKAGKLLLPARGYWVEPDTPENPFPTFAWMQTVDIFEWQPGFNRRDVHEVFIRDSKYGIVKGRFVLRALAGGRPRKMPGKPEKIYRVYWMFMRPSDQQAGDPSWHRDNGTVVPIKVWQVRKPKD